MSLPGILTPSATRALLDQLGHRPRKQLGQNFLVDGNIVRKSIALAGLVPGERVVEIGPGLGTLTAALLEAGAEVFAIERDPTMALHLRNALAASADKARLHLLEGDAVDSPLGPLAAGAAAEGLFKIVANLPYAISSPWMEAVLAGPLPARMVLMLQLESAQRFAAQPGTKSFGAISAFLQAAFCVTATHRVSRTCFHPVPEVDSTLIAFERLEDPVSFSPEARQLVRALFQHRRKQLAPMLRRAAPQIADAWQRHPACAGVRSDSRPEDVPVAAWIALADLLRDPSSTSTA